MDAAQSIKLKYILIKIVSRVTETRISGECVSPISVNFACKACILTMVNLTMVNLKPS